MPPLEGTVAESGAQHDTLDDRSLRQKSKEPGCCGAMLHASSPIYHRWASATGACGRNTGSPLSSSVKAQHDNDITHISRQSTNQGMFDHSPWIWKMVQPPSTPLDYQ
jgi:hypothetical protein